MISIIIPNWNGEAVIGSCLEAVFKLTGVEFEVIVVDNGSEDSSKDIISRFTNAKLIALDTNTGFSHAVNIGISSSKGDFVALLNSDTEVTSTWLVELYKTINSNPEIGIVTSKLINYFDRTLVDSAGDVMNIVGQAKSRGKGDQIKDWNTSDYVFSATGGASLYRRGVFTKIGLFEETYYMYFEDADLCYRAQKAGYKVYYEAKAIVYHMHRYSSNKRANILNYWLYRNFILFYIVNTPVDLLFRRYSLLKFVLVVFHTAYYLIKNKESKAVFRTIIWYLSNIKNVANMRRSRATTPEVRIDYLDSLRQDKKLKIFGVIF